MCYNVFRHFFSHAFSMVQDLRKKESARRIIFINGTLEYDQKKAIQCVGFGGTTFD